MDKMEYERQVASVVLGLDDVLNSAAMEALPGDPFGRDKIRDELLVGLLEFLTRSALDDEYKAECVRSFQLKRQYVAAWFSRNAEGYDDESD